MKERKFWFVLRFAWASTDLYMDLVKVHFPLPGTISEPKGLHRPKRAPMRPSTGTPSLCNHTYPSLHHNCMVFRYSSWLWNDFELSFQAQWWFWANPFISSQVMPLEATVSFGQERLVRAGATDLELWQEQSWQTHMGQEPVTSGTAGLSSAGLSHHAPGLRLTNPKIYLTTT